MNNKNQEERSSTVVFIEKFRNAYKKARPTIAYLTIIGLAFSPFFIIEVKLLY